MGRVEREVTAARDATQRESALQRWADDGGFIPEPEGKRPAAFPNVTPRSPWAAVGVAVGVGFVLGWFIARRK